VTFLVKVQQALLETVRRNRCKCATKGGRKHRTKKFVEVNTQNILFMLVVLLMESKESFQRLNRQAVGYSLNTDNIDKDNLLQYIIPKDIKDFGLIPEIIGRLPVLTHMDPLDRATLRSILTVPKNALIKQYENCFDG
jgi:ATP-dependent Clp protease ATP-binding subunit ClpX